MRGAAQENLKNHEKEMPLRKRQKVGQEILQRMPENKMSKIRQFNTGATRDTDQGKLDYEGFLSPLVLQEYARYMTKHRKQSNGELRSSDNWQKGIPQEEYMKSGARHFMDWWLEHDGYKSRDGLMDALCGLMFNVQGYLFEELTAAKKKQ